MTGANHPGGCRRAAFAVAALLLVLEFASADTTGTVILDTSGFWRVYLAMRTPVVREGEALTKIGAACDTPAPPADWTAETFDDSDWLRLDGAPFASWSRWEASAQANVGFLYAHQSSLAIAQLCLRGKFAVDDPAKVRPLKLTVKYRGGLAVHVNGAELVRSHLPADVPLTADVPAETYPREAYFLEDGDLPQGYGRKGSKSERLQLRIRTTEVEIPPAMLKKGTNVLALSLHRAPLPAEVCAKLKDRRDHELPMVLWDACGLHSVRLETPTKDVVQPNATRPAKTQVWNASLLVTDTDLDWGDPNEPVKPVRIVGTLGGTFSGKVLVGATGTIKGLKATVTDLAGPGGARIPASSVTLRCAVPDLPRDAANVNRFDGLLETMPAEVPVRSKDLRAGATRVLPGQPDPVYGAVAPVWVTVHVPADAAPGDYKGTLTVSAGADAFRVPVDLRVSAFRLPDPKDYRTFVELIESPDTLALEYDVPLWSDAHWKLVEKSLTLSGQLGVTTCYVPLINETNLGNAQSMVRWVKTADGKYRCDFAVLERYLDLVVKHQGLPKVVCFYVWDLFLEGGQFGDHVERLEGKDVREERFGYRGRGPEVTVIDGDKTTSVTLPQYSEAAAKPLWEGLAVELHERMKKRGLEKSMMLGLATDATPAPTVVAFWKGLLPDVPWASQGHSFRPALFHGMEVGYTASVWHPRFISYDGTSREGWKNPRLMVQFARDVTDYNPLTVFRLVGEMNVGGDQRGFVRFGADMWPVLEDRRHSRTARVYERYPKANWRNLNVKTALLAPGPSGPVATARFEVMREGIQQCEARIFIEEALGGGKFPPALAKRCTELIAERNHAIVMGLSSHIVEGFQSADAYWRIHDWHTRSGLVGYYWYITSGWQQRSGELYDLAAEVAAGL